MNNWIKGTTSLMITMAILASPSYAKKPSWDIEYPYIFDIQTGSYAWLVTPGRAEKISQLVFEWSESTKVLKINGDRVFPPVDVPPKFFSEAEYERTYKDFPIIAEWAKELGSWKAARERYRDHLDSFKIALEEQWQLTLQGEISEEDLNDFFQKECQRYPLSKMIARERGIKINEHDVQFYRIWYPEGEFCPDFSGVPQYEDLKIKECSRKKADGIVREIVGFYKIAPHREHLVFIKNGGPSHLIMGGDSVAEVNKVILEALNEKKLPESPSILSSHLLEHMMKNAEVGHSNHDFCNHGD